MSEKEWNDLFQLNVVHYFITCRELLPRAIEAGGGSIIMTSSHDTLTGERTRPYHLCRVTNDFLSSLSGGNLTWVF